MKRRKSTKSSLWWHQFRFRYRLSIVNDLKLEEVFYMRISWLNVVTWGFALFVAIILVVSTLIVATPLKNFLPGYLDVRARRDVVRNAIELDSIEQKTQNYEKYLNNLKQIIAGNIVMDTISTMDQLISLNEEAIAPSDAELAFRKKYESNTIRHLVDSKIPEGSHQVQAEVYILQPPVRGTLIHPFDRINGYLGVSLTTGEGEAVRNIMEGNITLCFEQSPGYWLLQIQHQDNTLSIYRNLNKLLKTCGQSVGTGEVIGFTDGKEPFEFEIWSNGEAINPESIFSFK